MKLEMYSKLVFLVIHISDCKERLYYSKSGNTRSKHSTDTNTSAHQNIVFIQVVSGETKACTGTLIDTYFVMTLASCLFDDSDVTNPTSVFVYLRRPSGINKLTASRIIIHPNFYSKDHHDTRIFNFGLIKLEKELENDIHGVELASNTTKLHDITSRCFVGGYGSGLDCYENEPTECLNSFKNYSVGKPINRWACEDSNELLCYQFPDIIPCSSDYGTPLICDSLLYAMHIPVTTSKNSLLTPPLNCSESYLTIFLSVLNDREWVENTMKPDSGSLDWLNSPVCVLVLCCVVFVVMGGIYYGLIETLQRTFDPADGLQDTDEMRSTVDPDEETWYDSQWVSR